MLRNEVEILTLNDSYFRNDDKKSFVLHGIEHMGVASQAVYICKALFEITLYSLTVSAAHCHFNKNETQA